MELDTGFLVPIDNCSKQTHHPQIIISTSQFHLFFFGRFKSHNPKSRLPPTVSSLHVQCFLLNQPDLAASYLPTDAFLSIIQHSFNEELQQKAQQKQTLD